MLRHSLECVETVLSKSDYEHYMLTYTQAYNYTSLIDIAPCAEQMFLKEYYDLTNDSSAIEIMATGLLYLIF